VGVQEAIEAAEQMRAKEGPYFERWLEKSREDLIRRLREIEEQMGIPLSERTC